MAINIGSVLGFFICGYLGEKIGWHYGFSAAGFGMALGIIRYKYSLPILGNVGLKPNLQITNLEYMSYLLDNEPFGVEENDE